MGAKGRREISSVRGSEWQKALEQRLKVMQR